MAVAAWANLPKLTQKLICGGEHHSQPQASEAERSEQLQRCELEESQRHFVFEHIHAASLAAADVNIVDVGGSRLKELLSGPVV